MTLTNFKIKFSFLGLICVERVSRLFHEKRAQSVSNILPNVVHEEKLPLHAHGTILQYNYR